MKDNKMAKLVNNTDQIFLEVVKEWALKHGYFCFYIDQKGCLREIITYELIFDVFSKITEIDIKLIKSEKKLKDIAISYFNRMIHKRNIIEDLKKWTFERIDIFNKKNL